MSAMITATAAVLVVLLRVPPRARVLAPLLLAGSSVFVFALVTEGGAIAVLGGLLRAAALGVLLGGAWKFRPATGALAPRVASDIRRTVVVLSSLSILMLLHNVLRWQDLASMGSRQMGAVNPWGMFWITVLAIYACRCLVPLGEEQTQARIRGIVTVLSIGFLAFQLGIGAGILPGNTAKLFSSTGGQGLANISTNESGTLGVGLLVWNLHFASTEVRGRLRHVVLIAANAAAIVLTGSRTAALLAFAVAAGFAFASRRSTRFKVALAIPAVLLAGALAVHVALTRARADVATGLAASSELASMPGSGRALIWYSYSAAFVQEAQSRPVLWLVGTGPVGLADLYSETFLRDLRLSLDGADFFPLHSDLVAFLLSTGLLGLGLIILAARNVVHLSIRSGRRTLAFSSLGCLVAVATLDMISYFPLGAMLFAYGFLSAVDPHPAHDARSATSQLPAT